MSCAVFVHVTLLCRERMEELRMSIDASPRRLPAAACALFPSDHPGMYTTRPTFVRSLAILATTARQKTASGTHSFHVDLEELELQPARYRPDRLEVISKTTRFSKKEIQFVYRAFKQECPTGMISEETFKSIYAKFFPLGGTF
ncbi:hypothetical protein B566_EDAN001500 [Ephemera danica]|nr:hypothetical protein B566_EDAN001500 [Ephemera danica]